MSMPYPQKMVSTVRKLSISSQPETGDDSRAFELVTLASSSIQIEVMDYVKDAANLRPLVILSPLDFPFPPSVTFCEMMKQNGFRVVYIRRPGFGGTPALPSQLLTETNIKNGAALMAEAAAALLADSERYKAMAQSGPKRVQAQFSLETCVMRHEALCAEVAGARRMNSR